MYVCVCICMSVCAYVCLCVHMYVCVCMCMSVCACVCLCVHVYVSVWNTNVIITVYLFTRNNTDECTSQLAHVKYKLHMYCMYTNSVGGTIPLL